MLEQRQPRTGLRQADDPGGGRELIPRVEHANMNGVAIELIALPAVRIVLDRQEAALQTIDLIPQPVALFEQLRRVVDGARVEKVCGGTLHSHWMCSTLRLAMTCCSGSFVHSRI